jgi:hypothetical protein
VKAEIERAHPSLKNFGCLMLTPEMAFRAPCKSLYVCLDEVGRYLPGQAEALIMHLQPVNLYITGDPLQGRHPIVPKVTDSLVHYENWLECITPKAPFYLDISYRLPSNYSAMLAVDCKAAPAPFPKKIQYAEEGQIIICPDEQSCKILSDSGHQTYTYGTCQGLDTNQRYVLWITQDSALQTEKQIWTAMTRSSSGFDIKIVMRPKTTEIAHIKPRPGGLLEALIRTDWELLRNASIQHRSNLLPPRLRDPLKNTNKAGKRKSSKSEFRTPSFQPLFDDIPDYSHEETVIQRLRTLQKFCPEYWLVDDPLLDLMIKDDNIEDDTILEDKEPLETYPHPELYDPESLITKYFDSPPTKDERETTFKGTPTDQVDDSDGFAREVYLRHRAKDETLGPWGIKKRIRWRTADYRWQLMAAKTGSQALIDMFRYRTGTTQVPWDEEFFQDRVRRSYNNLTTKDKNLNASKSFKCDPDMPEEFAYLLIKQQVIKKIGKEFSKAKAPQIITEHAHRVALDLAPYFMYFLLKTNKLMLDNDNCYIHAGNSDQDLKDYLATSGWDFNKTCTEDDAEAWDSNFTAPCVEFEFYLFDHFCAPKEIKERFMRYKCLMRTVSGPIDFMMFSGGPDTLPGNSIVDAILTPLRLRIPLKTPRATTGDDIAINGVFEETEWWKSNGHLIPMKYAPKRTKNPCAFGWVFRQTPHKDPTSVMTRLAYSAAVGKLPNTLPSLLQDVNVLMSNEVFPELDPLEQEMVLDSAVFCKHYRGKYRIAHSGVYQENSKAGSRRHYSSENISMVNL